MRRLDLWRDRGDSIRGVRVGVIVGHKEHSHGSDCRVSAERHRVWLSGLFQILKQQEHQHVQKIRLLHSSSRNVVILRFRLSLVRCQGLAAGDFYSHLDSSDLLVWHLLQIMRINGQEIAMDIILVTGIIAFVLMVFGLALTYSEFDKFD